MGGTAGDARLVMLSYLANRTLMMVPTLFGVAVLIFFLLRVVPGDIVEVKLRGDGGTVSAETLEAERKRMGLDKPLPAQFADWMKGMATFDFGKSMWTDRPVTDVAWDVGFASLGTFSRTFSNVVGCSPTEFRARHTPVAVPSCFIAAWTRPRQRAGETTPPETVISEKREEVGAG